MMALGLTILKDFCCEDGYLGFDMGRGLELAEEGTLLGCIV